MSWAKRTKPNQTKTPNTEWLVMAHLKMKIVVNSHEMVWSYLNVVCLLNFFRNTFNETRIFVCITLLNISKAVINIQQCSEQQSMQAFGERKKRIPMINEDYQWIKLNGWCLSFVFSPHLNRNSMTWLFYLHNKWRFDAPIHNASLCIASHRNKLAKVLILCRFFNRI